jgi:hypothetical protein
MHLGTDGIAPSRSVLALAPFLTFKTCITQLLANQQQQLQEHY